MVENVGSSDLFILEIYLPFRYIYPNTRLTYSNIRCTDKGVWFPEYVMAKGEIITAQLEI